MKEKLSQFKNQQYLNLETFRKNGDSVKTPVWFVENNGILYVRTIDGSGKVKRVRANSRVSVVPCEVNGEPKGEWVKGQARMATASETELADRLLDEKYGELKRRFEQQTKEEGLHYTVITITF